jgi:hypothetical protein
MTMPYPDNNGQTHYEGCWRERGHHNCAVALVERLEKIVSDTEDSVKAWHMTGVDLPEQFTPVLVKMLNSVVLIGMMDGDIWAYPVVHPFGDEEHSYFRVWHYDENFKPIAWKPFSRKE